MSARNRIVLGRDADVREGAANRTPAASPWRGSSSSEQGRGAERLIERFVARIRRRLGNRCAKVALAYLHNRHWSRTGLAKSSFYYALKKVKKIFHADKHWAKLHSTRKKRIRGLD